MPTDTEEKPVKTRTKHRSKPAASAPAAPKSPPEVALPTVKRSLPPAEFFRYWRSIPPEVRDSRVVVYAYRLLPLLDCLQPLTPEEQEEIRQKKRERPTTNLGKFVDPEEWSPDSYAQQCCEKWGAGDYSFYLNDVHPSVKKTVCVSCTSGEGSLRDWDSFPPVLDAKSVVLTEQKNQAYIRWARVKGIRLFGESEIGTRDEENNMAQVAQVSAIDKLTDTVVQLSQDRDKRPAGAQSDPSAKASEKTLEVLASAAQKGQDIISDAMKQAQQIAARANDPSEHTKSVIEMASAIAGNRGGGNDAMLGILTQMLTAERERGTQMLQLERERSKGDAERSEKFYGLMLQQVSSRLESAEKTIQELRAAPIKPTETEHAAGGLEGTLMKSVSGAIKEFITEKMTGDGKPDMPWWGTLLQEGLPEVLDTAKNIMANVAAMRAGAPPVSPTTVVEADGEQQGQQIQESPQIAILRELHGAMIEAMRAGRAGFEFGGLIIEQKGEVAYNYIANMGEGGIQSLLQSYAPLWADLVHPTIGPARTQQFIKEFLLAPRAMEAAAAIRLARQQAAQRARTPRPEGGRVVNGQGQPVAQPGKVAEQHQGPVVVKPQ